MTVGCGTGRFNKTIKQPIIFFKYCRDIHRLLRFRGFNTIRKWRHFHVMPSSHLEDKQTLTGPPGLDWKCTFTYPVCQMPFGVTTLKIEALYPGSVQVGALAEVL